MKFFYSDDEKKKPFGVFAMPYDEMPATTFWATHFENSLYLIFYEQNDRDILNRRQAAKELAICEKKMAYWQRHPNWDAAEAARRADELKKRWKV